MNAYADIQFIGTCSHAEVADSHMHTRHKNTGDMSQSVSPWLPVGEDTMCPEVDAAQLHNHNWSAWQRSRAKDRLCVFSQHGSFVMY